MQRNLEKKRGQKNFTLNSLVDFSESQQFNREGGKRVFFFPPKYHHYHFSVTATCCSSLYNFDKVSLLLPLQSIYVEPSSLPQFLYCSIAARIAWQSEPASSRGFKRVIRNQGYMTKNDMREGAQDDSVEGTAKTMVTREVVAEENGRSEEDKDAGQEEARGGCS